jgi:lysophospholipase L1-like esterase
MRILTITTPVRCRLPQRRRGVVLLVTALAATLLMSGVATAAKHRHKGALPVVAGSRYLALGDSYPFGYMEAQVVPAPNYQDPSSFVGYPEMLASELHLMLTNASCPGETTASMINPAAQSNNCENSPGNPHVGYRLVNPLHVFYAGSQLSFAVSYLRSHRNVRLVTMMVGGDDGLVCLETTKDQCSSQAEVQALVQTVAQNIHHILRAIRHGGHYRGQLVIVNYFSPLVALDARVELLNETIDAAATSFHAAVADGFGAFALADSHSGANPCTAGLLTQLGKPGVCGIHPSYAGQALLAQAVEQVIRL